MPEWRVETTRTVILAIEADSPEDACDKALAIAWQWEPEQADSGDQGEARAVIPKEAN